MGLAEPARGPVPPGTDWPGDLATAQTPVAANPTEVAELASTAKSLNELVARQSVCRACPRLVAWRERVAVKRRRSFADEQYWGRPIPGWGDEHPRVLIAGLAPAAHGGNRTGRIFTGDRSGDFLFASLYRCGLAAQPTSVTAGDGQRLLGARMIPAVRCAPPDNKPENSERDACEPWFTAELRFVIADLRVIVCLGHYAWQAVWRNLAQVGFTIPKPRPTFGHAAEVQVTPPAASAASAAVQAGQVPGSRPAADGGADVGRRAGLAPSSRPAVGTGADVGVRAGLAPKSSPAADVEVQGGSASASGSASKGERGDLLVLGCYHPSQQNTFTGRVTEPMLDAVFTRAATYAGLPHP